jgi:hypothetical protein
MSLQFTVTIDEAEVDAIIQRATEEVRALAAKSLTAQLIAPMVKERIVPQAIEQPIKPQTQTAPTWDDSITWDEFHSRVRSFNVPTAALLAQKASIIGCARNSHLHLTMAKPFAEQFARQQSRANVLIQCAHELLGDKTKVAIFTQDGTWYNLEYKDPVASAVQAQAVALSQELRVFSDLFKWFKHGAWKLKPGEIIYNADGDHAPVKAVKYCCVTTYAGQKVVPLFWLPRTPDLCYLDFNVPGVKEKLGPNPATVRRKWRQAGLLDEADNLTTRNMSIRGKVKRLVPIKIEALRALGIDTSWACEP